VIGQSECIINAQQMAGVTADQVDYVECHGTATSLGDPIEVQALRDAFEYNQPKENRSKRKTLLGAIKANIGHANSAAGTASLIKICEMLQNSTLPGQVNFNEPNPELNLDQTNFEIPKENREWLPNPSKQRLAGVSSFGVGGTNAHVIIGDCFTHMQDQDRMGVESLPSIDDQSNPVRYVIPISAKNRQSLENYKQALITYLGKVNNDNSSSIKDITYTLQERREHFNYRSAYCAQSTNELFNKIKADTSYNEANTENNSKIVFMFPGQGAQYTHMAKALYDNEQPFRDNIDQCVAIANQHFGIDFFDVIYPIKETTSYDINETQWTQVSLFTIEYALAKYLEHIGVKADAYIGHSIGEYVAATLSGVFSLEDAIKVVIARGRLMQSMQSGSMLAINAKEETIKVITEEFGCEIAVINSPEDIVVSGTDSAIKMLKLALDNMAIPTVSLNTSHAFHSRMMEGAAIEFEGIFKNIRLKKTTKCFVSNLTGKIASEEVTTARYWCEQLRNTVQFAKGIDILSRQYNYQVTFIEVGTGKGLSSFVNKYKSTNSYKSIQTLQLLPSAKEVKIYQIIENKEDLKARLWMSNIISKPNETELFQHAGLDKELPTYQFNYQKCWINKSNNIFVGANKNLIISKFSDEIDSLSILSKENVVNLLEKLLTPEKENISEDVIHRKIRIIEENCSEVECQIAQIIADILGIDQISIHDDFFRIGGNSIIAIRASHQISKALDCNVKVADIFQYKTINGLLGKIALTKADSEGVEMEF
jgi:acyl transferase domain-containing protein/acyl carrier protein